MKICSNKDIRIITAVMASAMLLGGCGQNTKPATGVSLRNDPEIKTEINLKDVQGTKYDEAEMDALYREYCINIFSQSVKDHGGEGNVMISPASIMIALDMVAAGAKGDSLNQLTDLFAAGQGPLNQQAYAAALMDKINGSKGVEFSCANAVWSNKDMLGDKINLEYVNYIQDTFLAEYSVTEFDSKTPDEINSWIYDHTDHMIEKVISELNPDTIMVLVNAIAFDGKWETPYEDYQITNGDFHAADGSVQQATFLNDVSSVYFETDKATGFMKTYDGGEYAFLAILPNDDTISANEFAKSFTPEDYEAFINSRTGEYEVISMMPEFKSDYECQMKDILMSLGVTDVFNPETADLSGIAGVPGDIFVSKVIHKTHIEVDRTGTKAAAVTAVYCDVACAESEVIETRNVICDRPFAYAIVDVNTMAPVFVGTVNEI